MAQALTHAGRYQIVTELGRGSMGVVYKGFDPVIGRTVAIKTMLIEGLSAAEFQEYKARFQREAQAAGILAHPNIVTVYDFGEDSGVLYLAMEYLEGKSLQELVEKQNILPVETILPIFEQVCSALDHAHRSNIIHRDIKPANIMILNSGLVKVTDFGIAKIMSMGMTQAGQILGTPNYMSPEQVKGRTVDGRSDVFALGVILYELVTGEKPFGGQNITTVIYKIINENPIPPRELDSTIHPGLSFVISKALAKNPDERFQTCRELAEALKNYRNLGAEAAPSATVVIKVPPLQAPPAVEPPPASAQPPAPAVRSEMRSAPPALEIQSVSAEIGNVRPSAPPVLEQRPPARPAVPPPAFAAIKPQRQGTSPVVWALLGLLLIGGIAGGGYYFLYVKNPATVQQSPPETVPAAQPSSATAPASAPAEAQGGTAAQPSETQTPGATGENTPAAAGATTQASAPATTTPAASAHKPEPLSPTPVAEPAAKPSTELKYGKVFVNSTPAGAQISVDGRSDPDWVTPHTIDGLRSGEHKLILSAEGYATATHTITIEAGRTAAVNLTLAQFHAPALPSRPARTAPQPNTEEPATPAATTTSPANPAGPPNGVWRIETRPPGAEVLVDGRSYGPSPVQLTLPAGKHTYAIKMNGVQVYDGEMDVPANQVISTRVKLE
jgi:serine/threonine protein kinase